MYQTAEERELAIAEEQQLANAIHDQMDRLRDLVQDIEIHQCDPTPMNLKRMRQSLALLEASEVFLEKVKKSR